MPLLFCVYGRKFSDGFGGFQRLYKVYCTVRPIGFEYIRRLVVSSFTQAVCYAD